MRSAIINVMTEAAEKASKGLLRDFGEVSELQISRKGTSNFVTESDKRAEKVLIRELSKARPGYRFLVEESGEIDGEKKDFRWIIDPLDGTHNFIHAVPYFCISIALEKTYTSGNTEILAGVIYDPIHNDMYTAEKNEGAFVNGRRLQVSKRDDFEQAMIVVSSPHSKHDATAPITGMELLSRVVKTHAGTRYMGASALDLAQLAAGKFDAVCLMSQQPWDVAAGGLLVQEAGGHMQAFDGGAYSCFSPNLIATNKAFSDPMRKLLA